MALRHWKRCRRLCSCQYIRADQCIQLCVHFRCLYIVQALAFASCLDAHLLHIGGNIAAMCETASCYHIKVARVQSAICAAVPSIPASMLRSSVGNYRRGPASFHPAQQFASKHVQIIAASKCMNQSTAKRSHMPLALAKLRFAK